MERTHFKGVLWWGYILEIFYGENAFENSYMVGFDLNSMKRSPLGEMAFERFSMGYNICEKPIKRRTGSCMPRIEVLSNNFYAEKGP